MQLLALLQGSHWLLLCLLCAGVVWCAHIGFDCALGYGLKYSTGFYFTHLGIIGHFAKSLANPFKR
ncbi:MAG: DUF4260 family protein [Methylotenera sp.]